MALERHLKITAAEYIIWVSAQIKDWHRGFTFFNVKGKLK